MPQQYILKKWTRFARIDDESDGSAGFSCDGSLLSQHGDLLYDAAIVIDEASMCKKAYQHAKKVLQDLKKRIREINEKEVTRKDDSRRKYKGTCHEERYLMPKHAKTLGKRVRKVKKLSSHFISSYPRFRNQRVKKFTITEKEMIYLFKQKMRWGGYELARSESRLIAEQKSRSKGEEDECRRSPEKRGHI